jgi:hypothetical protein
MSSTLLTPILPFLFTPSLAYTPGDVPTSEFRLGSTTLDGIRYSVPIDYPSAIVSNHGVTKIVVAGNLADLLSSPDFSGNLLGVFSSGRLLDRFTLHPATASDPATTPLGDPPTALVTFFDPWRLDQGPNTNYVSYDSLDRVPLPIGQLALFVQFGNRLWLALGADAEKLLSGEVKLPATASFVAFVAPAPPAGANLYAGPPSGYDPAQYVSLDYLGRTLVVPADTLILYLQDPTSFGFPGILIGADAQAVLDGTASLGFYTNYSVGRTQAAAQTACFAAGTLIGTGDGPRAVETLSPGDLVTSPWGELLPVIWTGHRRVDCRRHPRPETVWPVRVVAHAFGPGMPSRDLLLSPDHAVFAAPEGSRGVLIPIRHLINGVSVVQQEVAEITYWHVELQRHAILFAEGLPAESYLDTGNRGAFIEAEGAMTLHPDFAAGIWNVHACAPHVSTGPLLEAIHARLAAMLPFVAAHAA